MNSRFCHPSRGGGRMSTKKTYIYRKITVKHNKTVQLEKGTIVVARERHYLPNRDWLWVLEEVKK